MKKLIILIILLFAWPCWGATVYVKDIGGTVYYDNAASSCDDVTSGDTSSDVQGAVTAAGAAGTLYICAGDYSGAELDAVTGDSDNDLEAINLTTIYIECRSIIHGRLLFTEPTHLTSFGTGDKPIITGMDPSTTYGVVSGTIYSKAAITSIPHWIKYNGNLLTYVMKKLSFDSGSVEPTVGEGITEDGGDAYGVLLGYTLTGGTWGGGDAAGYLLVGHVYSNWDNNDLINGTQSGDNFATTTGNWGSPQAEIELNQFTWDTDTVYVNVGEDPDDGTLLICVRDLFIYASEIGMIIENIDFQFSNNKGLSLGNSTGTTINDNNFSYIEGTSGKAIEPLDDDNTGFTIDSNTFVDCRYPIAFLYAVLADTSSIISYNDISNSDWFIARYYWMGGINLNTVTGCDVIGNYIHDVSGDGISFKNADSNTIYSNLVVNVKDGISIESSDSNIIYNNTIYGASSALTGAGNWPRIKLGDNFGAGTPSALNDIQNNNIYAVSSPKNRLCLSGNPANTNNTINYNHYYTTDAANLISWNEGGGAWAGTLAQFKAAFANKYEQNALVEADPKFADIANYDFHLLVSSPCIDAGDDLTATVLKDIDGQSYLDAQMDIGADEYYGGGEGMM